MIGNDVSIAFAAASGECELNVMRPVIIRNLMQSFEILKNCLSVLRTKCVDGIRANREKCRYYAENSFGIAAALNPHIGYSRAAECVKEASRTGKTLRRVVLEKGLMSEKALRKILSPGNLTQSPG